MENNTQNNTQQEIFPMDLDGASADNLGSPVRSAQTTPNTTPNTTPQKTGVSMSRILERSEQVAIRRTNLNISSASKKSIFKSVKNDMLKNVSLGFTVQQNTLLTASKMSPDAPMEMDTTHLSFSDAFPKIPTPSSSVESDAKSEAKAKIVPPTPKGRTFAVKKP